MKKINAPYLKKKINKLKKKIQRAKNKGNENKI